MKTRQVSEILIAGVALTILLLWSMVLRSDLDAGYDIGVSIRSPNGIEDSRPQSGHVDYSSWQLPAHVATLGFGGIGLVLFGLGRRWSTWFTAIAAAGLAFLWWHNQAAYGLLGSPTPVWPALLLAVTTFLPWLLDEPDQST